MLEADIRKEDAVEKVGTLGTVVDISFFLFQ